MQFSSMIVIYKSSFLKRKKENGISLQVNQSTEQDVQTWTFVIQYTKMSILVPQAQAFLISLLSFIHTNQFRN